MTLFCKDAREDFLDPDSVDLFLVHPPYFKTNYNLYGGDIDKQINNTNDDAIAYMDNFILSVKSMEKALSKNGSILIIFPNVRTGIESIARIVSETNLVAEKTFIWDYSDSHFINEIHGEEYAIILHLHKGDPYVDISNVDNFIIKMPWTPSSPDINQYEHLGFVYESFPEELALWLIPIFSRPGDVVADIFGGTGTTCMAAKKLNRAYIYSDVSIEQYNIAKARLNG